MATKKQTTKKAAKKAPVKKAAAKKQAEPTLREDMSLMIAGTAGLGEAYAVEPAKAIEGHAGLKALIKTAEEGIAGLRPVLEGAAKAAGGTFENEDGKATYSWTEGKETVDVTEDTTALLETKGILENTVDIHAVLKSGVDVNEISDAEMKVMQKYFDVSYHVNMEKLDAQITLGAVTQADVDATLIRTPGKGYGRLLVTPEKELKKVFMP